MFSDGYTTVVNTRLAALNTDEVYDTRSQLSLSSLTTTQGILW